MYDLIIFDIIIIATTMQTIYCIVADRTMILFDTKMSKSIPPQTGEVRKNINSKINVTKRNIFISVDSNPIYL